MYLIEKNTELTTFLLGKILNKFQTKEKPELQKSWDYYHGKQNIMLKTASDVGKPNNKLLCNYCYNIVNNYLGYIAGVPVTYSGDKLQDVLEVLRYNDVQSEDTELLRQALIFGRAFEINYIDEEGKQRFRLLDARECIPVYDNTLNNDLACVVRFYNEDLLGEADDKYIVEVYDNYRVRKYRSNSGFSSFFLIEERQHFFSQCPITVFSLNRDEDSIFKQIITLQDAYNQLASDEVDDFAAFCDAYLVLKGAIADQDDLDAMKQNRVLMLDSESSAEYLTKSISDTQIQNMLDNIKKHIHIISNSPDFTDETFNASTGIALRLKLIGFENTSAGIEQQMRKALTRRVELICEILKLTDTEFIWRDMDIAFTRNLPVETENIVNMVNSLRGLVSTETLLAQLPFVNDAAEEAKKVKEEAAANMELYGGFDSEESEEE